MRLQPTTIPRFLRSRKSGHAGQEEQAHAATGVVGTWIFSSPSMRIHSGKFPVTCDFATGER